MSDTAEKFTFFYSGPFSQWAGVRFVVDNVVYNKAEQFMMAEKARLFGDLAVLDKIMATSSPSEQQALGREVSGYVEAVWRKHAPGVLYRGNHAKFTQNQRFLALLLATHGTTLVEASPKDRIYGIGLSAGDPRAQRRETWRGGNLLGETLTRLCNDLMRERLL